MLSEKNALTGDPELAGNERMSKGHVEWQELDMIFGMTILDVTIYAVIEGRITLRDIYVRNSEITEFILPKRSFIMVAGKDLKAIEACWLK